MNLGSLLPNLKSTLIRVNTSQGPDMSHLLQGRISPLQPDTGLLSPLGLSPQGLFLIKTFHNMIQTPLIIGKYLCLTCPHSTLKRSTLILSLPDPRESMPRSSTSVMGLDDEKGRQELRPRGPSSILPLSSVIKDAFDKFLRVNMSNLLLPLLSGTGWDSPVFRIKFRSSIRTLPRSVLLLNPLGPLSERSPFQFSKNWSIRLDKISQPSISPLPLLKLLLLAMLP